jgi:hypothetical protein
MAPDTEQQILAAAERERVQVSSGIEDGDRIVVSPIDNAVEGMRVRVQEVDTTEQTGEGR